MSSFLSWVAGTTTSNNSGKSIDLFLTQLESMPKLLDKRQSVNDLYVFICDYCYSRMQLSKHLVMFLLL